MAMGLLFLGQQAAAAKRSELLAQQHHKERMDRALHGHHRLGELTEDERAMLADIQKQLNTGSLQHSVRCCPECHRPFALVHMRDVTVDYCTHCRSSWFQPGELGLVTGTGSDTHALGTGHRKSKYNCPACQAPMWETVFRKPFTLLVDRCPHGHGVYLEQGELERALKMT